MAKIVLNGFVGDAEPGQPYFTLVDVIAAVEKQPANEPLTVEIESYGGFVDEGQNIATYLKGLKREITTISNYKLASIAVSIFLAGNTRLVGMNHEGIIIHTPFGAVEGDAAKVKAYGEEIQAIQDTLAKEYSKATGISTETITDLLKNETKLTAQRAVDLHFATGFAPSNIQACAKLAQTNNTNNLNNENNMNLNEQIKNYLDKMKEIVEGSTKIKNMILKDVTGKEINIERTEGEVAVGDAAKPDGDFLMEDGKTIVVKDGKVTEIKNPEEKKPAEPEPTNEITNLKAEIANLTAKLAELENLKAENTALKAENAAKTEFENKVKALHSNFELQEKEFTKEQTAKELTVEDIKAQVREKMKKIK